MRTDQFSISLDRGPDFPCEASGCSSGRPVLTKSGDWGKTVPASVK